MDFDAKYKEKFSSNFPLFLHDNISKPREDQFSLGGTLTSKGAHFLQVENFDLNVDGSSPVPNSLFPLTQTCLDTYENPTFGCTPNFGFYETKPFGNHATTDVALIPLVDNFNLSGGVGILGHPQMITPLNSMISPSALSYNNPFCYYDLAPARYRLSDEDSCTTPNIDVSAVSNHLSATTTVRKGGRDHSKKSILVKGQWTIEEDRHLIQLVERYGVRKWSQIAQLLNGRVGKQCRERWHNHLKPDIKKDVWSEEEDKILIKAHTEIGNKWAEIAKKLPGRTENSIKNHWNATKRRQFSKRKCKSKYPRQSSLLQEYIKSLTLETINAGCRKKPLSYSNHPLSLDANAKASNDQTGSSNSSSSDQLEAPEYDFSEVPDFNFDAQIFEESSIDSLLDYAPNGGHGGEGQGLSEVLDDSHLDFCPLMIQHEVKREFDLMEMMTQVNL